MHPHRRPFQPRLYSNNPTLQSHEPLHLCLSKFPPRFLHLPSVLLRHLHSYGLNERSSGYAYLQRSTLELSSQPRTSDYRPHPTHPRVPLYPILPFTLLHPPYLVPDKKQINRLDLLPLLAPALLRSVDRPTPHKRSVIDGSDF
ncbi:hypothetical protein JAAARDRAFT_62147 [Jaapia argillacea MUCL 33604]|uniref:Uncharacterized protein n=1 Tax=Jaapia argillacea MUCL 33604 TaxID=933084 RepID=A0A067PB59_9AGAM|nr:hypothetical protein JAAARDRAFT_62147 [Jaapia argillacea MUCL 33604]